METFIDLIDAFGPKALAKAIGVSRSHVHTMRARNSIPPIYWGDLVNAAPSRGISNLTHAKCRELREGVVGPTPAPAVTEPEARI